MKYTIKEYVSCVNDYWKQHPPPDSITIYELLRKKQKEGSVKSIRRIDSTNILVTTRKNHSIRQYLISTNNNSIELF